MSFDVHNGTRKSRLAVWPVVISLRLFIAFTLVVQGFAMSKVEVLSMLLPTILGASIETMI